MIIGILGFGNLGSSLARGLIKSGCASSEGILVCDNSPEARGIAESDPLRIKASEDVNYVVGNSDVVFLTVKGYVFEELAKIIDRNLLKGKTVVSFMAGVSFERIVSLIGEVKLVRAMPSLAIASCEGVIGYTEAPPEITEIFSKLGYSFETSSDSIEKVMAFSSCGLGFAAYLIDAFASAGASMGFSAETSEHIAALTFLNAARRGSFSETVKAVATKGGATEQGVFHMDNNNVFEIVADAVMKAYEKMICE